MKDRVSAWAKEVLGSDQSAAVRVCERAVAGAAGLAGRVVCETPIVVVDAGLEFPVEASQAQTPNTFGADSKRLCVCEAECRGREGRGVTEDGDSLGLDKLLLVFAGERTEIKRRRRMKVFIVDIKRWSESGGAHGSLVVETAWAVDVAVLRELSSEWDSHPVKRMRHFYTHQRDRGFVPVTGVVVLRPKVRLSQG